MTRRVTFGPNAQMTSFSKMTSKKCIKLLWFLSGFSPAHKNCKKLFSDKFFKSDINISYLCKIILLKWSLFYWLICNGHIIDMCTVYVNTDWDVTLTTFAKSPMILRRIIVCSNISCRNICKFWKTIEVLLELTNNLAWCHFKFFFH